MLYQCWAVVYGEGNEPELIEIHRKRGKRPETLGNKKIGNRNQRGITTNCTMMGSVVNYVP